MSDGHVGSSLPTVAESRTQLWSVSLNGDELHPSGPRSHVGDKSSTNMSRSVCWDEGICYRFLLLPHSGVLLHDPPVALPHHLPVLLLLHGRLPLPLPYPVPGLTGRADASQPLPDHGGVLLKWERWGGKQILWLERASERVKEEMMSYRKKTNGLLICHKPTRNILRAEGYTERGREDEEGFAPHTTASSSPHISPLAKVEKKRLLLITTAMTN